MRSWSMAIPSLLSDNLTALLGTEGMRSLWAFHRLAVNFDPVRARRRRCAAARHEVGPADLRYLGQIRPIDPCALDHLADIQLPPVDIGYSELPDTPVRGPVGLVADQPRSIGKLQDY